MTQATIRLAVLTCGLVVNACGSVDSAENLGDPIVTVVARLETAPPNMPASNLRATLVWLNGPPFGTGRCEGDYCEPTGRNYTVLTTSDVEVDMQFPLTVRLGMFQLPNPISGRYGGSVHSGDQEISLTYNSVPEAEVVLYEDGNGNHELDLLPPGEAGPGPDRIVALSSGRDEHGVASRTVVVNKRSPVPAGFANNADAPALEVFAFPLPKELTDLGFPNTPDAAFLPLGATPPPVYPDGVYALRLSAPPSSPAVQRAILASHSLVAEPDTNDAPLLASATETVEPIEGVVVQLFPVTPDRKSWLARGCNPFNEHTNTQLRPPPGAEVQCGAGALRYALNPGDYCGWTRVLDYSDDELGTPAWWPCDGRDLKPGQPYRAAQTALEDDIRIATASLLDTRQENWLDAECSTGRIHHYDAIPGLRIPTAAPPSGSEVMCYGADALSFIPARTDGCRIKYTYELASDAGWDMRDARPDWWPCDGTGQLRADTGYAAPSVQQASSCGAPRMLQVPVRVLPVQARVRCESPVVLSYAPLWSDGCEPVLYALQNHDDARDWDLERPAWWPCDSDGNFISGKGYMPW